MDKTLIHGNCLDELTKLDDQSVNLIFTSPPYNMNLRIMKGRYTFRPGLSAKQKEFTTKYSSFNDALTMDDYYWFTNQFIKECLRVSDLTFYNVQFLVGNKTALFEIIGTFAENLKRNRHMGQSELATCDTRWSDEFQIRNHTCLPI